MSDETVEMPTAELASANGASDAPPGSVLAQLRARAAAQRQVRYVELPVGGAFGDKLLVRYGVLPLDEADRYAGLMTANLQEGADPHVLTMAMRMMVAACETVLWVEDETETDLDVGFDGGLAELLGHPLPEGVEYEDLTNAEVIEGVFASPMAILAHSGQLAVWQQDPHQEVELAGEA